MEDLRKKTTDLTAGNVFCSWRLNLEGLHLPNPATARIYLHLMTH
jgi:hypothetical protein